MNENNGQRKEKSVQKKSYRGRYRKILFFFAGILLTITFWDIFLPRIKLGKLSERGRSNRYQNIAKNFRAMAIRLGGVMIKVGQFLSTRVDVLPAEITQELAGLQDEVPAERFEEIQRVAETDLGMPLAEKFAGFNPIPIAAASLGQVHQATLWLQPPGELGDNHPQTAGLLKVVVKVQRPNIEEMIQTDLSALQIVGRWLESYPPIRKRADIKALLNEFSTILYEEIDYLKEGVHAETFAENFQDINGVYVPRVVWSHTTRRVLTLEDVEGIKITDFDRIGAAQISHAEVASRLIDVYLKQIFEDGFFHADPHPGNLFVRQKDDSDWDLVFVDFGMVGRVPPEVRLALRELLMGVGSRDANRVVRSYQMLGLLLPSADLELIKKAEARIFENFWGKSMDELRSTTPQEVAELASEFRQLIFDMPFQIPYNIIFLARAVGILSGIATGLHPGFNIWLHLAPYAERFIMEEAFHFDPKNFSPDILLGELGELAQQLVHLPRRADSILTKVETGNLLVRDKDLADQMRQVRTSIERAGAAVIFSAFLVSSILLYTGEANQILTIAAGFLSLTAFWQVIKPRS